jgi:hypothetical protein
MSGMRAIWTSAAEPLIRPVKICTDRRGMR